MQRVWAGTFCGVPAVVKQRFKKRYRHPALDAKLTAQRLKQEVRSMLRARKLGVPTPTLLHVDMDTACIYMERVPGVAVKAALGGPGAGGEAGGPGLGPAAAEALVREMGVLVARLHDGGVVHGDLTTSNVMAAPAAAGADGGAAAPARLVLIDFGLSSFSSLPEDRAVDIYVLERAFSSAHAQDGPRLFEAFLESYRRTSRFWSATLNKFAEGEREGGAAGLTFRRAVLFSRPRAHVDLSLRSLQCGCGAASAPWWARVRVRWRRTLKHCATCMIRNTL
jgi:TP53 regulating kinase-like protein